MFQVPAKSSRIRRIIGFLVTEARVTDMSGCNSRGKKWHPKKSFMQRRKALPDFFPT
jgi:hypothetical protein